MERSTEVAGATSSDGAVHGATIQDVHDMKVTGGLSVAARDVHHNTYHIYGIAETSVPSVLKPIPNYRNIHIATLGRATQGTGVWILVCEAFRLWLDSEGFLKIMWGSGMPGAGKTVLASIVIHALEAHAKAASTPICVNYIYIRYGDQAVTTVQNFLAVFVKQTVERHPASCLPLFDEMYASHIREETQPSEEELLQLLQSFTKVMKATFYIIDALDEAPPTIQQAILERLASLDVKLFVTSRPLKVLEKHFPSACCFSIIAHDHDIARHVNAEISRSAALCAIFEDDDAGWRTKIISSITQKCNGMFLHASLQLEALKECTSIHDIQETLEDFPSQIESVYLQTWDRILKLAPKKVLLAKTTLLWVINATRPMTVDQLRHAVATSPETHQFESTRLAHGAMLVSLCCGLVTMDERSSTVSLVHDTAKKTLERLILETFPRPHCHLSAVCMTHLTACRFQDTLYTSEDDPKAALEADPLLAYAYHAWSSHARLAWNEAPASRQLSEFVAGCQGFPVLLYPFRDFDNLTPLHVAAFYNLPIALAGGNSIQGPNLQTENVGATPLYLACLQNSQDAVKELLCLPNISVNETTRRGRTALIEASRHGDEGTMTLLLAHPQINVNLADHSEATALSWASRMGREGTVKLLLAHPDIDVNWPDESNRTPLIWASLSGDESTVKALLDHPNINVNLQDESGVTAMSWAARLGHEGTVKLFLAHRRVDVNLADETGRTPLMGASLYGDDGMVKILLAHPETNVNLMDTDGWTALIFALRNGFGGTAMVLLSHPDMDLELVDNKGQTPLMWASHCCDDETVEMLLHHPKTNINQQDEDGWTALIFAVRNGRESIVKILLAHPQIDANIIDNPKMDANEAEMVSGRTALILTTQIGSSLAIMEVLLNHPHIDVNVADSEGATALICAARDGRDGAVELLLAHPQVDVNARDEKGLTALDWASRNGHDDTVELLLERCGTSSP